MNVSHLGNPKAVRRCQPFRTLAILCWLSTTSGFAARNWRVLQSTSTIYGYQQASDGELETDSFRSLYSAQLPSWILDRCDECEWSHPTRIQKKVLDTILTDSATDAIVQAETGSGKTLAFLLPCLAGIDSSRSAVQALIVVPTRELGLQVARVAKRLAAASADKSSNKIMVMSVLQGSRNRRQRAWAWAEPPHLVIGTPQELCSMIRLGGIKRYNSVKYLVVDEVDACLLNNNGKVSSTMLASSGTPLHELLSKFLSPTFDDGKEAAVESDSALALSSSGSTKNGSPRPVHLKRQTIFCSATIPQHRHFLKQCVQNNWMLNEPVHICLRPGEQLLPSQLEHAFVVCASSDKKLTALRRLSKKILASCVESNETKKILIFCEPHRPLEEMAKVLAKDSKGIYWSEKANGDDMPQPTSIVSVLRYEDSLSQRATAMDIFRGEAGVYNDDASIASPASYTGVGKLPEDPASPVLLRVLLSDDLAARGLDIVDISHVIHLDLPESADTYVHRAGRTGRFRRTGQVISVITPEQEFVLQRLVNKLNVDVQCIGRQSAAKRV